MNDPVIQVKSLGKRYRIGPKGGGAAARRTLTQRLMAPFGYLASSVRKPAEDEVLWALNDVSFDVAQGEVVGLIGHNGAGKSTLLKVLSRITEPTRGEAVINGRVGSLLEVGTGFHPELTGRENIFLSGAVMGMRRAEIERKFDEIVAFAGTERFLDLPVKRYSSGMYVRLAFAVAAHLEPEILLIDEVLAVGDAAFQKKCLGKMGDVASEGRTVLFVSHNMIAIQNLCERAIWFDSGELVRQGPASSVISDYLAASFSSQTERIWHDPNEAPGNEKVRLHRVALRAKDGDDEAPLGTSTPLVVEVDYWNQIPDARLHVCLHVLTDQRVVAFSTSSNETDWMTQDRPLEAGLYRSVCRIPAYLLNSGGHQITVLILENGLKIILRLEDALSFEVVELEERAGAWYGKEPGVVRPRLEWTTQHLEAVTEFA